MAKNNNKRIDPMSNSRTMGREGIRILKDIAFSRYNVYTDGHIFRNIDFVKATIAEVDKRLMEASIHVAAIQYAYQGTVDPNVLSVLMRDQKIVEAYGIAREALCNIIATNGDTAILLILANKLPKYKYNM